MSVFDTNIQSDYECNECFNMEKELGRAKKRICSARTTFIELLTDPHGKVCCHGSDKDKQLLAEAIDKLYI